jgi:hypothetical protein
MSLDRDWKSIPVELWPEKMILGLDNMDPLLLRNVDCAHYGTFIRASSKIGGGMACSLPELCARMT